MPKLLTSDQVEHFRTEGFITPVTVMAPWEAQGVLDTVAEWERASGKRAKTHLRGKPHLLLTALARLIRHPRLLDAAEDLIGPNLLCLETGFLWKDAHDPSFVAWHQDNSYLRFDPPAAINTWIALTDSKRDNGAMEFVVGSHAKGELPYEMIPPENHMLKFSRRVTGVDTRQRVMAELEPGQISIHGTRVVHGSEPNASARPRIGFGCIFVPPHVRTLKGGFLSASLVRGRDTHGHFELEPEPQRDFDPASVAAYDKVMAASMALYKAE
ncbi:MAG: phytanoyl-CoA dioxygenase family protein [Alphaproteobacteria bacterium]